MEYIVQCNGDGAKNREGDIAPFPDTWRATFALTLKKVARVRAGRDHRFKETLRYLPQHLLQCIGSVVLRVTDTFFCLRNEGRIMEENERREKNRRKICFVARKITPEKSREILASEFPHFLFRMKRCQDDC